MRPTKDYWKGAPKIERLNIKIVEGSQLYAGLKSGEIDITQNTMSTIPLEDYESVAALENVEVSYGDPITNQSVFINTARITDTKVRQAMLYAVDRNQLLEQLLKGNGEVADGFLSSASPYFDSTWCLFPMIRKRQRACWHRADGTRAKASVSALTQATVPL